MPVLASSSKAGGKKRKIDISGYERASNSLAPPIRPAARRTQVPPDNAVGASSAPTSTFFAILGSGFNQGTTMSGSSAKKRRGRPPAAPDPNNRKKGWTCSRCLQSMQHDNKRRHLLKLSVVSAGGVRTTGEFCIIKDKATIKRLQEQGKRNNTNADRFAISVCLPLAYHPSTTTNIMRPPRPPLLFRGAAHADRCPFLSIRPCTNRNANCVSPPPHTQCRPQSRSSPLLILPPTPRLPPPPWLPWRSLGSHPNRCRCVPPLLFAPSPSFVGDNTGNVNCCPTRPGHRPFPDAVDRNAG